MLPEVTYEDYQGYGGGLTEEAFKRSLAAAVSRVKYIIGFNVPEGERQETAYKRAVCAAIDVDAQYGASGGIGERMDSLSIGSFSIGGIGGSDSSGATGYDEDMETAIRGELVATGLLYQGIG